MSLPRPTATRLLVRRFEATDRHPSGLILPPAAQEAPHAGMILAIGPGQWNPESASYDTIEDLLGWQIHPGDTVIYGNHSGITLELEGEPFTVLAASEVLLIIHADPEATSPIAYLMDKTG